MHLVHPVMQRINGHPTHHRVVGVDGVAASGVIQIPRLVHGVKEVIGPVVEPAPAERGPLGVTLGRVVEDHVQDHLDTGPVEFLDHGAELVQRAERVTGGGVGGVRGEERHRAVTPIVDQARRRVLRVEHLHRHQLHRSDSQRPQIGNLGHQTGIGAGQADPPRCWDGL